MKIPTPKGTTLDTDQAIAADMLAGTTTATVSLAGAVAAANNPDLRRLFKEALNETIVEHEALATFITDKGWKKPFDSPDDQLRLANERVDSTVALRL